MNKQRREAIERAEALLREAQEILEGARDDEQDYFDNMPDNIHDGDKGSAVEGNIQCLEEACGLIAEVCDTHIPGAIEQ